MTSILEDFRKLPDFSGFQAFARALWDNEAAVMIGSGFSRVCSRESDAPSPPLWGDFARKMEAALGYMHNQGPDALRLAQEYEAQHGRDGLDRLIREMVPDDRWEPSLLHEHLVELPWQDILTTNWDTLLERTSPRTPDRIYGRVQTVQDIASVRAPRIIKLHGSLPSHNPFIFTEDDFRTYPKKFAPFVNLAQQVMLENELCLLGFSGIDPNFLQWSGWVRDTLEISARQIRLVGVLNLTPAARTLLVKRNVTPIDLGPLVRDFDPSERHERALDLFFKALIEARPASPFEWDLATDQFNAPPNAEDADKASRREVAEIWAKDRKAYPGWVIANKSLTRRLSHNSMPTMQKKDEKPQDHLRFVAERIWRDRTARTWMHRPDLIDADKHFDTAASSLPQDQRTELCVNAASYWRVFRNWDEWSKWMARLSAIGTQDARLFHAYEGGWKAMLDWDDTKVQEAADALLSDSPIWMMRRAALLSTLLQYKAAAELYQTALTAVRQKLRAAPKSAWLISLESWGGLFHKVSYSALKGELSSSADQDSDQTRLRHVAAKADPWDDISHYERLSNERTKQKQTDNAEWELSFKPGRFRAGGVRRIGGDQECPFYGLLSLMEQTGAPERSLHGNLFSDRIVASYRAIRDPDEDDLLAFLARYRGIDRKILDQILPRLSVALMTEKAASLVRDGAIARVNRVMTDRESSRTDDHLRFLLALLARVVIRSESAKALELFRWATKVLNNPDLSWTCYDECGDVLRSLLETMSDDDRQTAIGLSLHLKLPSEADAKAIERDWPELIGEFSSAELAAYTLEAAGSGRVDGLIEYVRTGDRLNRTRAISRLHSLFKADKLTPDQSVALENAIWSRCSENGLPDENDLHPWIYLDLPGHEKAEPLFMAEIIEPVVEGKISADLLLNLRAGSKLLSKPLNIETLEACIRSCISWRPKPKSTDAYQSIFNDGERLENETAKEVGHALAHVLLPAVESEQVNENLEDLIQIIPTLEHIPSISATAFQIGRLCPSLNDTGVALIRAAIASRSPERVYPAFVAIKAQVEEIPNGTRMPDEIRNLLLYMVEQRLQPGLGSAMKFVGDLMDAKVLSKDDLDRLSKTIPTIYAEYRYDQDRLDVPSLAELPSIRREIRRLIKKVVDQTPDLEEIESELATDALPEVRQMRDHR